MPRLLGAKNYPALVDVYYQETFIDPNTSETIRVWRYDDPETYQCNFMSLKGHAEEFGDEFYDQDAVKLEVSPASARTINLSMRFGNIRMRNDETQEYYKFVGDRPTGNALRYYFNIDSMNPQVDHNGRVVCVEIYGVLTTVA